MYIASPAGEPGAGACLRQGIGTGQDNVST
jgi:hypothetical protein